MCSISCCAQITACRRAWRMQPAVTQTLCCARGLTTRDGTILPSPANTSRSVARWPKTSSHKSKPSPNPSKMKRHPHPWQSLDKCALEKAQLAKLRDYLERTVLPFSAHYGALFEKNRAAVNSL